MYINLDLNSILFAYDLQIFMGMVQARRFPEFVWEPLAARQREYQNKNR